MNTATDSTIAKKATILTGDPTIALIAEMSLNWDGIVEMADWVSDHRPECLPDEFTPKDKREGLEAADIGRQLFPHDLWENNAPPIDRSRRPLRHNELLVELAGRKCYDSFGLKAGRKSNKEYIENTQSYDVKHASILYHAKMSFFFAGISRRVSHEIIRNYVGADRSEEGNPSQESTRFTHHYGFFVMPPRYLADEPQNVAMQRHFRDTMDEAYEAYLHAVNVEVALFEERHNKPPTTAERKRIYEAASSFLPHQSETSFIWTTNPMAISKFCFERDNESADLEIQRFARKWKKLCVKRAPNLFPQPHMKEHG